MQHSIERWRIRLAAVAWFVLGLGFLLGLPVVLDSSPWALIAVLVLALLLALPASWIWRVAFDRDRRHTFVLHWMRLSVALLFGLSFLAAAPIYYLAIVTETRPVIMPQATLTNGHKTVVFQGMQHVGSENFYQSVIYDVEKALAEGYVIYYEGVKTETPESKEFFAKLSSALTGNTNLTRAYKIMSQTCGLKFQTDYFTLLEADKREHPDRHVIADVDAIEMKQEYERLMQTDPEFARVHADDFSQAAGEDPSAALAGAIEWLESGSEGQKKLAGVVCRGIMTLEFAPKEAKEPGKFDPIVLDLRNRALAERITGAGQDKIFITYGARHLSGVFDLLKQQDPNWRVATVKWIRTIEVPKKHFEGMLPGEGG